MLVTQGSYRLIGVVTEVIYFLLHAIVRSGKIHESNLLILF